ncbi:molybdopterin molybdenumtransferase MoeA [Campylobacter hyointestinalis subsp. hyointestinalis]|uniref:molybdopterin molybdotransferase MoeA n=1 Tax=Campylobacter hyointestinalis TaxID=198 RepID=UPI000CE3A2E0|nr:molybdopterin molybdotransferase MoeA [Campylobacter hyointestinalis]PPB51102.1 molybdopterin molybdenumtransferase MoeA [Campylobacter hyointestinalis subsp. hyointestinalis]
MKSYDESLNDLLGAVSPWDRIERIPLSAARDRIACEDIVARRDYPEFPTSAMDGYAIKFEDLKLKKLKILGSLPAGSQSKSINLKNGECLKTFTGALLCDGSDTIIPIENVNVEGENIEILQGVAKGFAVRPVGESYKKNDILIKKGTKLGYSELGLLAELGISYVNVYLRPKVAVLSTGSEIVDIGERPKNNAQIHSSNHIAIANMVACMNCEVITLPIIKDDHDLIKQAVINTLKSVDFIITTGGVSVGDFDFMRDIVKEFEIVVNKAAIKPGRHIKVAKLGEKYIFALPGFPYSAMVTCALYFREFIDKLLGVKENYKFKAILAEDYHKKSPFEEFSAASTVNENGVIKISTRAKKSGSSAIVTNLNNKAVLLRAKTSLKKGEIVEYITMV